MESGVKLEPGVKNELDNESIDDADQNELCGEVLVGIESVVVQS